MTIPSGEPRNCRPTGYAWVVLGLFGLLAIGLMWPVPAYLSSRVPGSATWAFDESTFLWNDWYLRHALLDLHTSPLHSELIWFPLGIDLILYTFNYTNAALSLPLQLAFNLPLASNMTLLLATALSGFSAYLLALYVLHDLAPFGRRRGFWAPAHLAALLAGVIYAAASNRAIYAALGHYDLLPTQWLAFYALYLLKTLREPRPKNAIMAGLFFALAALTEMSLASFLAMLSLVILLASWRGLRARWQVIGRLALAGVVAVVLWSPILIPTAREFANGRYALKGWGESLGLSADLVGLVTPTNLNPLLAPDPAAPLTTPTADGQRPGWQAELRAVTDAKGRFSDINTVFLGYATLGLALLGAFLRATRRRAKAWAWAALVFGILCLGPLLQIGGRYRFSIDNMLPEGVTFPLPFSLLHFIPVVSANRAPNRHSVILMLALAVLASLGAWWLLEQGSRVLGRRVAGEGHQGAGERASGHSPLLSSLFAPALAGMLAVLLVVEHLAVPLPTIDVRVPDVYRQIAAEPGQFSILQLPLGWRNSFGTLGSEATLLQYYQTLHGKPIIGGNISRAPDFKMDFFRRIPLFRALTELEMYREVPPELDRAAREQAGALTALYDIRYFITFPPVPGRFPYYDTWQRVQDYALKVLPLEPQPFWEQDGIRAYRVRQPAVPFPFRLDLGTAGTEPYMGQGWDANLTEQPYGATGTWIDGQTAELYLPLDAAKDVAVNLSVAPLAYPGAQPQTVAISVNEVPVLAPQPLKEGWQTVTARVPSTATRRGPNRVRLTFAWAASPRKVFPDPASRGVIGSTGVVSPVNLDVHSFSEAFVSAFDSAGAETKASVGRRGYNVVVVDPKSGQVVDRQGFDTVANRYEVDRLSAYLQAVQPGKIVVLATKGEAGANLTPAAVAALRNLGSRVQAPSDLAGQAHALVGVQGAAPGSAAEAIVAATNPDGAFLRVAGDFRSLSAAVDWVEMGP